MTVDPVREWMDLATQDEENARFQAGMRPSPGSDPQQTVDLGKMSVEAQ